MITIKKFKGLDSQLYTLVAPLIMNPEVLRSNRNYPFKTSENFIWFIALDGEKIVGFLPVEIKEKQAIINNYYIANENLRVLQSLVRSASTEFKNDYAIYSVTQNQHISAFTENNFIVDREWINYVRMRRIK